MENTGVIEEWAIVEYLKKFYYFLLKILLYGYVPQHGMVWNAYKQGKVSDCSQRGDHDPCFAVFKFTPSFLVAPPGWHSSKR